MISNSENILRNKKIDLLRAYAVLCVWVLHCCLLINNGFNLLIPIRDYINLEIGVDVFFVISGYVVSDSLYRISQSSTKSVFLIFIKKRLKRLWLTASVWLFICMVLGFLLQGTSDWPSPTRLVQQFLAGLVYLFNFQEYRDPTALGYFWSLSVEFQFYTLLPLFFFFKKRVRVLIAFFLFMGGVFYRFGGDTWWMFRYDGILLGIIIFDLKNCLIIDLNKVGKYLIRLILPLILLLMMIIELYIDYVFLGKSMVSLLAGLLLVLSINHQGVVHAFGLDGIANWIGLRSYSIYLAHIPMTMLLISIFKNNSLNNLLLFVPLEIVMVLVVSELSYKYLECFDWSARIKALKEATTH